jgi:hypothetical protein
MSSIRFNAKQARLVMGVCIAAPVVAFFARVNNDPNAPHKKPLTPMPDQAKSNPGS